VSTTTSPASPGGPTPDPRLALIFFLRLALNLSFARAEAVDEPAVSSVSGIVPVRDSGPQGAAARAAKGGVVQLGQKKMKAADERLVRELAQRDRAVRAHEAAHQSAAGSLGGAATFTLETGPDGKSYAVGGEVPVDMSSGRTPEETLSRAQQVRAAALAPADPSPQDLAVAAQASQIEAIVRQQMSQAQSTMLQKKAPGRSSHEPVLGTSALSAHAVRLPSSPSSASSRSAKSSPASASASAAKADAGETAATTLAALTSQRASEGTTSVQLQQLARLAAAAYRI